MLFTLRVLEEVTMVLKVERFLYGLRRLDWVKA